MVYTSIPSYLDPPPNWNQQQYQHQSHHQQQGANGAIISTAGAVLESNQLHLFQPPPPPQEGGSSNSSVRPNSMVDRARQAKLPPPEQAVKCPRCDSTNTKFCYYNNYSLSQPRHFCKTCRRYWTRGGALRNVPVGGGFRRNKRGGKSSSSSKSSASTTTNKASASNSSMAANLADRGGSGNYSIISPPHIPFMNSSLPEYGVFPSGSVGLNFNFAGIQSIGGGGPIDYPIIGGGDTGVDLNNWRHQQQIQQFPSFTNRLDQQTTPGGLMYQLQEESDSGLILQRLNLPKQNLGMSNGNGQNLAGDAAGGGGGSSSRGGVGWITTDLNGFD